MPAYSQRKRKIAKKSTRRSKKRLSRRIKTRRGGGDGKMNIGTFKNMLVAKLDASKDPEIFDAGITAQNFINDTRHKDIIGQMIEAYNKQNKAALNELKINLKVILRKPINNTGDSGQLLSYDDQVYENFIDEFVDSVNQLPHGTGKRAGE